MNATELLNQAADLIEKGGWVPGDGGFEALCVGNAVYQTWKDNSGAGLLTISMDAVKEVIGVDTIEDLWRWNDAICLDRSEAVNTLRKAAENVEAVK